MTDHERIFDALPPARGHGFARTWWGKRWLAALEDTALDAEQLRQGRRYARRGAVGAVSVRPGRVTAVVRDDDGAPQRADVLLQELDDSAWERLLTTVAREAGHLAALLDGEMPPHLVADADAADVGLLPVIGDLEAACTCDAWDHCPHTAALSYQVARLLDEDPFVLLLLRGRDTRTLLEQLGARGARQDAGPDAGAAGHAGEPEQGVDAREAFTFAAVLPPLPGLPVPPAGPAAPLQAVGEGSGSGPDPAALAFLVADAAARARRTLADARAPGHAASVPSRALTGDEDAVRLAAGDPPPHLGEGLAAGSGRTPAELELAVRAWRFGGAASLAVLEDGWVPEGEALARARGALAEARADGAPALHEEGGRWTAAGGETDAGVQLRYGRDGRWWPYLQENGTWCPAGPAERDPAAALATALDTALP